MSIKDQARMIIADAHAWAESKGEKSLISYSDKQEIYQQARKKGHTRYLDQVISCFKELQYLLINLEISFYHFANMLVYLEAFIRMVYIKGTAEDAVRKIVYDLLEQKLNINTDERTKEDENKLDEEASNILKNNWFNDAILNKANYFDEPDILDSFFDCKTKPIRLSPNKELIDTFNKTLTLLKEYKKFKKQVDLLIQRIDINLLSVNQEKQIKDYEELVDDFISFKGLFSLMKLYIRLPIQPPDDNQLAKEFINNLNNIKTKTDLSEDEITECENEVEKIFNS